MPFVRNLLPCLLLAAGSYPAAATSFTSAAASFGATMCNQSGTTSAVCNVNGTVGSQTARASASATSSWTSSAPGVLEATASGFGEGTSAQAAVSYSNLLMVTGATGSGDLQINFVGFQDNIVNIPAGASVSALTVGVGSSSTTATLPGGGPTAFSVVLPIAFNTPVLFSASFSATATGTFFHDGTFALDEADGILQFPSFAVTSVTGLAIPGATVSFVPEPASWVLFGSGLLLVIVLWVRPRNQVS